MAGDPPEVSQRRAPCSGSGVQRGLEQEGRAVPRGGTARPAGLVHERPRASTSTHGHGARRRCVLGPCPGPVPGGLSGVKAQTAGLSRRPRRGEAGSTPRSASSSPLRPSQTPRRGAGMGGTTLLWQGWPTQGGRRSTRTAQAGRPAWGHCRHLPAPPPGERRAGDTAPVGGGSPEGRQAAEDAAM